MRRILPLIALTALAACDVDTSPVTPEPEPEFGIVDPQALQEPVFQLTLLHNNDGESALLPQGDAGGVARFATVVANLKAEARDACRPGWGRAWDDHDRDDADDQHDEDQDERRGRGDDHRSDDARRGERPRLKCDVLMVSSGDNYLAGPQFNASVENSIPFFDAQALDRIGYDALAIGNHEFDFGPDVLADFIESFSSTSPPFLSANLVVEPEPRLAALQGEGRIARSTVVHTRGGRVGIIGATTPSLPFISSPRNVEVRQDVAGAISAEVRKLRWRGVDQIILISHLQSILEDQAIIPLLSGVDIVVAGGGDNLLANSDDPLIPGDVSEGSYPLLVTDAEGVQVPVVTTSGSYRYVGRLVVQFDRLGRVVSVGDESGPIRVVGGAFPDAATPDAQVQALVEAPVAASVAALASNVIGTSEVALDGLRTSVRTAETNQGNLVADAFLWLATELAPEFGTPVPDIALQNGGGMRDDEIVPAGPITELKTFDILPFANFLSVAGGVSRAQLKEVLENAVSRVEARDGRFAQVAGLRFEYTLSGTPQLLDLAGTVTRVGTRVRNVWLTDGTPIVLDGVVQPGPDLTVATLDFLLTGGDQYPFRGLPFTRLGATYQQALESFIEGPLGGVISVTDYPVGGEGRVVQIP